MRKIINFIKKYGSISMSMMGLVWSLLEIFRYFFPDLISISVERKIMFFAAIIGPIANMLYGFLELLFFRCKISEDAEIKISIGNILNKRSGTVIIGINDKLVTDVEKIGEKSIHHQLMMKQKTKKLEDKFKEIQCKNNKQRVSMGYHFSWTDKRHNYLFLVMSELQFDKAPMTNKETLIKSMRELFSAQNSLSIRNKKIFVPVIGTGAADVRLTHADVVRLIAREYIFSQAHCIGNNPNRIQNLNIVVYWRDLLFGKMFKEWRSVCEDIRKMVVLCGSCEQNDLCLHDE